VNVLEALKSTEFLLSLGTSATASGLRRCLQRSPFVQAVRESLLKGEITEEGIRRFVGCLEREFQPGIQFFHEPALAALAVALEGRRTAFAEGYLYDLARLNKIAEMDLAPRVAGACLKEWMKLSKVVKRKYSASDRLREYWIGGIQSKRPGSGGQGKGWTKFTFRMTDDAET